ncbi:MAG: Phage integrase family protein [Candidatus Parcubacteria bacterium]|nr:Phage integrase family protein [Candidatus Parcubacteria bacterium]
MKIVPRKYQELAIQAALVGLIGPLKRALVVMATGLGKTFTAAFITKAFRPKKTLFLVHNNHILHHAMLEFKMVFGENTTIAVYNGLSKNGAAEADIVFATWQTMGVNLKKWKKNHFDLIIVDEAHHAEADTYRPTLRYFTGAKLGITATPNRANEDEDIRNAFGDEVIHISREEAIARGWLPPIEYHVVTDESLDEHALQIIAAEIKEGKERFTMAEVNRCIFIKKRDEEIAKIINGYSEKALVFCASIGHSERLAKSLELGATFHSMTGKSQSDTWDKNQATLTALKNGLVRRVCAVNAFNEGVNVPSIGLVAFCRTTDTQNVFDQQLGRGLRPGKDKLIVLDFVGNLERVQLVLEMMNKIADLHEQYTPRGELEREGYNRQAFEVSGKGFEFTFSDRIVDLMNILKHCEREFYPTWQEASAKTQTLGVHSIRQYHKKYRIDSKLPSNPNVAYPDYPGDTVFLGRSKKDRYGTCEEASTAAKALNAKSVEDYKRLCEKDSKLPKCPDIVYEDFPGWNKFLGTDKYPTWQEASASAKKLKITSHVEYARRYKEDVRLHSSPWTHYKDWPGLAVFLGVEKYATWQEASAVIQKLGVQSGKSGASYRKFRKEDKKLPSDPQNVYKDFPGWGIFLGTGREHREHTYKRWQTAATSARKLGIRSKEEYAEKYKSDKKLPSSPSSRYADFPGWPKFLRKE